MLIFDSRGSSEPATTTGAISGRLDLVSTATPLEKLSRLSDYLGREICLKR